MGSACTRSFSWNGNQLRRHAKDCMGMHPCSSVRVETVLTGDTETGTANDS